MTPILDRVNVPADLKALSDAQLRALADELRSETVGAVAQTGGHLGSSLGVVELTVAIHAVFDTPRDNQRRHGIRGDEQRRCRRAADVCHSQR